MNRINKFWQGKLSLWKSYWIVGELLNALVIILIYNFEIKYFNNNLLFQNIPILSFNSLHPISKIILFIWSIYITVGIWRSAENYRGNFIWTVLTLLVLSYRIFTIRLVFFI